MEFDEDLDVDTVGGLLALELGRVPLPGAEVMSHGLRLRAEGGRDHRGRVRIGTVLVSPAEPEPKDDEDELTLDAEDAKLVVLARGAMARAEARQRRGSARRGRSHLCRRAGDARRRWR